jgi:hypothetical protein
MKIKYYLDKGFVPYAIMKPSNKYKQGIEIWYPSNPIKSEKQPAVYVLSSPDGTVLKIGETQNLTSRFHRGYRCITNSTNNKIRTHVKEVESIHVHVFTLPIVTDKVLGYKCETSYVKGLEWNLLDEFKRINGILPELNVFRK